MANWLRLRRQSHAPREQDGTETIYAAADGTLKHMDPDGNVSSLAGSGSLPDPTEEGDVLTVSSGEWAGAAPAGGSGPLRQIRVPIAFDTPNLLVQAFDQVSASSEDGAFVISGDQTAAFSAGSGLTSTSDLNSGAYTVVSAAFAGGNTTIVVEESVADEGATGQVINAANGKTGAGITLYEPTAGEQLYGYLSYVSAGADPWDGNSPALWVYQEGQADYTAPPASGSSYALDTGDADVSSDVDGSLLGPNAFLQAVAWIFADNTPLRLVVDDTSGGAPGSTSGTGEVVIFVGDAP